MDKQRLSIAMCTYNGIKYLDEQLASIAAQTRLPDEVIICDDGSTDGTLALLKKWAKLVKFPVKIRSNAKRLGLSKNFEKAISLCSGDLIALSDQDDVWRPNKLEILEHALAKHPEAGYAFSDRIVINERGKIIHPSFWKQRGFNEKKRVIFSMSCADQLKIRIKDPIVGSCTMVFRASLNAIILPISELWIPDGWIVLICSLMGMGSVAISEPLIYYRRHPTQYTAHFPSSALWCLKMIVKVLLSEAEAYDNGLPKWNAGCSRVREKITNYQNLQTFQVFKKFVNHLTFRNRLYYQSRLSRLAPVITELTSGGYHSYSGGVKSAIKDLLIKPVSKNTDNTILT